MFFCSRMNKKKRQRTFKTRFVSILLYDNSTLLVQCTSPHINICAHVYNVGTQLLNQSVMQLGTNQEGQKKGILQNWTIPFSLYALSPILSRSSSPFSLLHLRVPYVWVKYQGPAESFLQAGFVLTILIVPCRRMIASLSSEIQSPS